MYLYIDPSGFHEAHSLGLHRSILDRFIDCPDAGIVEHLACRDSYTYIVVGQPPEWMPRLRHTLMEVGKYSLH